MSQAKDDPSPSASGVTRRKRRGWGLWMAAAVALAATVCIWLAVARPGVSPGSVLLLDWSHEPPERSDAGLLSFIEESPADVFDIARALETAASDPNVTGVLVRLCPGRLDPSKADELRGLLQRFRVSRKPVLAFVSAPDIWAYHVAAAADRVILDATTTFDVVGLRLHALFLKEALQRFGIEMDLLRTGAFKGAFEELALSAPTPEFEEAADAIVESLFHSILDQMASARGLEPHAVRALVDRAPLTAGEAARERLVDEAASLAAALAWIEERTGLQPTLVTAEDYLARSRGSHGARRRFAVLHVQGVILEGETRPFLLGGQAAGCDTIARELGAAAADPEISGILLRIDSPGGSVAASEALHDAVVQARKAKPLVASCGGTAASGGYYVACAAEKIVAQPTTLTGSIGVFGGKVVLEDLLREQKVESRVFARGKRARLGDVTRRYTAEERLALKSLLDEAYQRFVSRVAVGRRKGFEEVHAVAQGRVWTGASALELGLVDRLGGLQEAVSLLRESAQVPAGESIALELRPPREDIWSLLTRRDRRKLPPVQRTALPAGDRDAALPFSQLASALEELGLWSGTGRLALSPLWWGVK